MEFWKTSIFHETSSSTLILIKTIYIYIYKNSTGTKPRYTVRYEWEGGEGRGGPVSRFVESFRLGADGISVIPLFDKIGTSRDVFPL